MAPTPAHLRAAADRLRATARRLDAGLDPLAGLGGHATWQGPAATSHRRAAVGIEDQMATVVVDLTRCADRLDRRADALEAAAAAEAQRAAEARRAAVAAGPLRREGGQGLDPGSVVPGLHLPPPAVPPLTFADALIGGGRDA